ncbi:MAG: TlpA disulfide reductase family protein [Flavobacteriales bacterium]
MNRFYILLGTLFLSLSSFAQEPIRNYDFTIKINNVPDSIDSAAFMANYYGNKQYYFDTVAFEPGGVLHFKGDSIMGGIYSIILSDKKSYLEFVVNEQNIDLETNFGNYTRGMKVKTSEENKFFYEYLNFVEGKAREAESLKKKIEDSNGKEKEKNQTALDAVDQQVIDYKKAFMEQHPDLFISKVFKTSAEPEVPDFSDVKDEDERQRLRYLEFKKQYLKDVDFTDERLLRTPVFHNKLNYYVTKLIPQVSDSIIKEADMLVARTGGNREMYKYVVHHITSKYEDSKIMGLDAVLVHMGLTYYCPDKAWWLKKKKLDEFCERVAKMEPILIGKQAPDLILMDTNGQWVQLYQVNAPYTVLYFWDSGCGHCKKVTPKLKEFYEQYHSKGVEVFAIGTEFETKDWKKYIKKNELPWINVSDNPEINENAHELIRQRKTTLESLNFRDTYDIFSTPKVFLLDENKKIIATKLMPEQLGDFIDHLMKEKEGEKKEESGKKKK